MEAGAGTLRGGVAAPTRQLALLVAGCFFMEMLDGTIVVTAIPRISTALGSTVAATGLIVTAYFVTLAVLIPLSAWMTARFGGRAVFLGAIAVFTVASLGCALCSSLGALVALRVLQGAGGAMMVPVGRIIVFQGAPKDQIMRLTAYIIWPALIAPVVAPLIGGIITTYLGWEWLFLVNVPLGVVALGVAYRLVHVPPAPSVARLDVVGVVLTCTGLGALTYAAHLVGEGRPDWALVSVLAVASVGLLVAAVRHLRTTPAPLVNLATLRIHTYAYALAGCASFWIVVGALPFLLPLLFEEVFGWSAIRSGAVVLVLFLGNIGIKPATTALYRRFGFRTMLLFASVGLAASTLALALVDVHTPLVVLGAVVLVSGVTRSLGGTGYTTLGLSDVPGPLMRDANALLSTMQQLFIGLGVAGATLALRAGGPLGDLLPGTADAGTAYRVAFALLALVALASAGVASRLEPTAGESIIPRPRAARS